MEKYKALDRLLTELDELLNILDKENLSSYAIMKKEMVSDILRIYVSNSSSCDEEYISMNKLVLTDTDGSQGTLNEGSLANGSSEQHLAPPQKSLPDLPPPKFIPDKISLFGIRTAVTLESYYEEAEPYAASTIEDGEAVSSSYESYDEEESNKGKGTAHLHQWPSTEASIELMKDALMCAFLWRKKWLGQWAKQLCVIKDNRLMCYKSSKDQSALLDVSLIGCTVTYKEKQVRKKEHKLKIVPASADVIVLGMQSKDQAEQWLKVIQDISGLLTDGVFESSPLPMESQRLTPLKGEVSDRCSAASESGSSTDGHPENPETKEVKKKGGSGLKLSNIMNIGRKKSSSIESSEKTLETSNYLNVLIQSQWKSRYCCIKDGQLHFYQDKNKSKVASQSVCLAGCEIVPQPSQDHLYSFQILHSGEPLVTLEAKSSEEMGHWLGLLMSESGSKTNLEDFNYDYVDAERVSCIISAAKNSYFLMQRKYSEPNTYIDNPRGGRSQEDDLYDDVDVSDILDEDPTPEVRGAVDKTYLEVMPSRSFLHCAGVKNLCKSRTSSPGPEKANNKKDKEGKGPENVSSKEPEPPQPVPETANEEPDKSLLQAPADPEVNAQAVVTASPQMNSRSKEKMKVVGPALESKLGKNRTEAEAKRFTEEKEKLEQEREEIRTRLTELRKEKRELKAIIAACTDKNLLTSFEEKLKSREEECKEQENRRVDLELCIVEVKENLKKAELGPFTLGTTVDTTVLDSSINVKCSSPAPISDLTPVNAAVTLKSRPLTILTTGKGNVLQKAKEWEQKSAS